MSWKVGNVAIGDGVPAIASLAVTFGGFSPTAMDGVEATREHIDRVQAMIAKKREADKRLRELERARTSSVKTVSTDDETTWKYVVVDESAVRIVGCESKASRIEIPATINDLPVYAIAPDACAQNDYVEEIICADSVEKIGSCAFRFCQNLRKVVLPKNVSDFSATWLSHCPNLRDLTLPGMLSTIGPEVFDNNGLKRLIVGPAVAEIKPGAFQKTQLEEIVIDEENPFIKSDGAAIYTNDGRVLLALAVPVETYSIKAGCKVVGKKATFGIESLRHIKANDGLETLMEFAFSHSGLESFEAPSSLRTVGEKAFYHCKALLRMALNDGIKEIGASAFEESMLESLYIPASIEYIGNSITTRTRVKHSGSDCSLVIDSASKSLFLDGSGGLYKREDDGIHLLQLIDRDAEEFSASSGADIVDNHAFAYHESVRRVVLPEGLKTIGRSAFRCCSSLVEVVIPDTVTEIGEEAFIDTNLESFRIPAGLETLGKRALVTYGAHHGQTTPSLRSIEVAQGNDVFFMHDGMLCERVKRGVNVVVFTSCAAQVIIPDDVVHIEDYAFNNASGIDYLELSPSIETIGTAGLTTWCWIRHIRAILAKPIEGRTTFDFYFPDTLKSLHGISNGIGGASWVNVPGIMSQYDICVIGAHDYNKKRDEGGISIYDQAKLVINRLSDPVLLTKVNRTMYDRLLRNHIIDICMDIARHDDREAMDKLIEWGYVDADNIESVIAEVGRLQDAAMTGYLLEVKRLRFNKALFDFDL